MMSNEPEQEDDERVRRWRLMLGSRDCDGTGHGLGADDVKIDNCLTALYDAALEQEREGKTRGGSLGASAPGVARWLGDIRSYFPVSVVKVMQQDALERLNIKRMLLEPELLESVEPDVHLVSTLLSLGSAMPNRTKETARMVVRKVVDNLMRRLANPTRQAISGALNRAQRNNRPRHNEMDWQRTIRLNLKHYQAEYKTIIPDRKVGFGRKRSSLKDIILCVDQSGSMAASVVYSGIFASVLASLPAVNTSLVVFDTSVVDLTDKLSDPIEVLFGTQLGGGTDIHRALTYSQSLMRRPSDTIFVLISDLFEGGNVKEMLKVMSQIALSGASCVALLALNDEGAPMYDHTNAAAFAAFGVPSFACTPDLFPELMAAAINKKDLSQWASQHDLLTSRSQ
ncbi:MAG: VWA domain-containing protein [Candidatus Obscuribacterales bacterium]|jgi:Mg-chelatase subunit ChlD|nr:VWA domain-containing protein [Candidatus Obscuribacterales bacterium]